MPKYFILWMKRNHLNSNEMNKKCHCNQVVITQFHCLQTDQVKTPGTGKSDVDLIFIMVWRSYYIKTVGLKLVKQPYSLAAQRNVTQALVLSKPVELSNISCLLKWALQIHSSLRSACSWVCSMHLLGRQQTEGPPPIPLERFLCCWGCPSVTVNNWCKMLCVHATVAPYSDVGAVSLRREEDLTWCSVLLLLTEQA